MKSGKRALLCSIGWGICLVSPVLAPPASAGVPRSCIHPQANPLECPRDTRRVTHSVLPRARVKALRQQRRQLEREAAFEDRQRNRILRDIREGLRRSDR